MSISSARGKLNASQEIGGLRAGQLSVRGIVFMVVAAASPMGAMFVGAGPSIGRGNGIGTPGVYLLASLILALFAVGFVAMSRFVTNAGAFYAYITQGLGSVMGFGAAAVALLAYNVYVVAILVYFGVFAATALQSPLHIAWPWEAWSALAFGLLTLLSYFHIELSAKVLGVLLVCEVLVLATLDIAVLVHQGPRAFPLSSFAPRRVFSGAVGVSVIYAFSSFTGFEATAIYGEEARDPTRTVPRATYLAVGLIAGFYVLTLWALIAAYGVDGAVAAARANPEQFVFRANERFVGFTDNAMSLLICTSIFAALLAFHNAAARYMYALARDRVLPHYLSIVHPRHGSPFRASLVQLALTAISVLLGLITGVSPGNALAPGCLGVGALGILSLQASASFSVIGFFRRRPHRNGWTNLVAPLLAGMGLTAATVLAIVHFDALTGVESHLLNALWALVPFAWMIGGGLALRFKKGRPDVYARFGRGRGAAAS